MVFLQNIHALDVEITNKEFEGSLNAEYNRTLYFIGGFSETGRFVFNERLAVKGGISLGWANDLTAVKLFTHATFRILADWPLEAKLAWAYNGMPEAEAHSHAIAPIVSWNAKYWGISAGFGVRFTSFYGEPALFELLAPVKVYGNFINNDKICVGMSLSNFNDFHMDSFIAFALGANVTVKLNEMWSIVNELEYTQSGADGLTSDFHGIAWKGGVKCAW